LRRDKKLKRKGSVVVKRRGVPDALFCERGENQIAEGPPQIITSRAMGKTANKSA